MTLAAPSYGATPVAEYAFPQHPPHAHVTRDPVVPVMPSDDTLEPCPELLDGPVQALSQGLCDRPEFAAQPCGDRLAPSRQHASRGLTAHVRQAKNVDGLRCPLATPRSSFHRIAATLDEARLVRVPFEGERATSLPQVAQARLGRVCGLTAGNDIIAGPHDHDVSPGVSASPLGGPQITAVVEVQVRQPRAGTTPLGRPFLLMAPWPILPHARVAPRVN